MSAVVRLPDGRIGLGLRKAGADVTLAVDPFASPPLVTIEGGAPAGAEEPGFVRAAEGALRGSTLAGVRARRGDRLLRLTFASRSRFGVGDEVELYLELVPRFGNLVLVKRERVVAAAKEFSPAENARRSVQAGLAYAAPPLPGGDSMLPKLLAASGVEPAAFAAYAASESALRDPLYVYRSDGGLLQAHLYPLTGFDGARCTREPSLLALMAELRAGDVQRGDRERAGRRRRALLARLDERERKLQTELASLDAQRRAVGERDALRNDGEAIFASLHTLPPAEQETEKARAAKLFARYKKLGAALPHVERRERDVRAALAAIEMLRWEVERAGAGELDDAEEAVGQLDARRAAAPTAKPARRRKRVPLEFRTAAGSRILVGRSPLENAEVTFKIARPHDLWFHARGTPGAHVVLARDDRAEPPEEDVETAASLAAYYSKAKSSARAAVDYTLRKYVRKQRNAPPGLVWYTNASTATVEPREPPPAVTEGVARPREQDSQSNRSGGATT